MRLISVLLLAIALGGSNEPKISDLGWISGCWEKPGRTEGSFTIESWGNPHGMMLGMAQNVRGGKTTSYEFLRIEKRGNDVFYVAKPSAAKKPTSFKLISLEGKKVVFENPEHDFPKKIQYQREEDVLYARISAGKKAFELKYKKTNCAP